MGMDANKWSSRILWLKSILIILYLSSHLIWDGERMVTLSSSQQTDLFNIIKESDSARHSKRIVIQRIETYLSHSFDQEMITNFDEVLRDYNTSEFPFILSSIKFRVRSFFWLTGNTQAFEIIFWSIFGVLSSLLYHGSEAIRTNTFKSSEVIVHIAKIFYAPICTIVIIFSINALTNSGDVSIEQFQYWLIILSFILGFYSGRTIELLNKLKDLILPLGKTEPGTSGKSELSQPENPEASSFSRLTLDDQDTLIRDYLQDHGENWRKKFPEVTGISAGRKKIENKPVDLMAIVFQVAVKKDVDLPLPKFIDFKGYKIPTDIEAYGITKPLSTLLEGGLSRINQREFGTIGIPVTDEQNHDYILSCFHVLFPAELQSGIKKVSSTDKITQRSVISPCLREGGQTTDKIGEVIEGEVSAWLDIGVFKPDPNGSLVNQFQKLPGPYGVKKLTRLDEHKTYVQFWGNGSKKIMAMSVLNIFSNQWIEFTVQGNPYHHYIRGLVQLGRPATGGDSGAPVFDAAGNYVGTLIGSDDKSAYMIPYHSIITYTKFRIKTL
jgi:hypothetical protein